MKNHTFRATGIMIVLALAAIQSVAQSSYQAYCFTTLAGETSHETKAISSPDQTKAPIPFAEIAAKAGAQYQGDGLSVLPSSEGARVRCVFLKLGWKCRLTLHELTHPRPLPGGEQGSVRVVPVPFLGGVRGEFKVPMHGIRVVGAFHEPRLVWSPAFRRLERPGPAEAGTPSCQRLHGPNACEKAKGGFP